MFWMGPGLALCQALVALGIATVDGEATDMQPATLLNVPLFHVTGEVPVFLQSFAMGRKLVLMPKWDAETAMRLIEAEKVTYFVGVPLGVVDDHGNLPRLLRRCHSPDDASSPAITILPAAIDFHPFPQLIGVLQQQTGLQDGERIKSCIWLADSALNGRKASTVEAARQC
eukprot:gene30549-40600_t